ncbi:hypothetical protein [Glutamicibacter sp. NPDC087583]|uniref:hypothetical protein n=1 Tax=Glutamicibacter sp. NPDC087583 TaxID=3363995 RepID=UPI0037F89998
MTVFALNIEVLAFLVQLLIADSAAVGRMESESSVDPGLMLPNSELIWLVAYGSVLKLVVLVVLIVAGLFKMTGCGQRSATEEQNAN